MAEVYKDKIEVSLDGRQIFYLFFGGAVIVGLVFVLGVMVGRRVEARGHVERAHVEAAVDPLAALDRLEGGSGLSFQGALRGAEVPKTPVEAKIEEGPRASGLGPQPEKKPEEKKPEEKKPDDKKKNTSSDEEKESSRSPKPEVRGPRYTLQLSSFQDKSEADAYAQTIKSAGFEPRVTEGDVDGKQFYRVRLGSYRSLEAANDAKADFEKASKKTALVTKL